MTVSILRTADGWWVQTAEGASRIQRRTRPPPPSCWPTVGAIDAAVYAADTVPAEIWNCWPR